MGDQPDYTSPLWTANPPPIPNDQPGVHQLAALRLQKMWAPSLAFEMVARGKYGQEKYGTKLQPHNGRDWRKDLFEELLDAMVYAYQGYLEGAVNAETLFHDLALLARAVLDELDPDGQRRAQE